MTAVAKLIGASWLLLCAFFYATRGILERITPIRYERRLLSYKACITGCPLPAAVCSKLYAHTHAECPRCGIVDAYRSECLACRKAIRSIGHNHRLVSVKIDKGFQVALALCFLYGCAGVRVPPSDQNQHRQRQGCPTVPPGVAVPKGCER